MSTGLRRSLHHRFDDHADPAAEHRFDDQVRRAPQRTHLAELVASCPPMTALAARVHESAE